MLYNNWHIKFRKNKNTLTEKLPNNNNQNILLSNQTEKDKHKKNKMNVKNLKGIMSERDKITFVKYPKLDSYMAETEKKNNNRIINTYLSEKITELNEQTYAGSKLVCRKIDVPLKITNKILQPGWEFRLEIQKRNL